MTMLTKYERAVPLHDRVLVKRIVEKTTAGGLHLPDSATDEREPGAWKGEVLATGPGKFIEWRRREVRRPLGTEATVEEVRDQATGHGLRSPMSVKAGQLVLVAKYSGTAIGDQLYLIRDEDVLAIVEVLQ